MELHETGPPMIRTIRVIKNLTSRLARSSSRQRAEKTERLLGEWIRHVRVCAQSPLRSR
jgi:hypothetical protein